MATTDRSNASLRGTAWIALAGSMGVAAAASGAASNFTTLNSSVVTLTAHGGAAINASATYTGPSNNLSFWSSPTALGPGSYGTASWGVQENFSPTDDNFGTDWRNNGASTYTIEMAWNVTFARDVQLTRISLGVGVGTVTYTPAGGSAATLSVGALLSAGTYDIVWNYTEPTSRTGVTQTFDFRSIASSVPGTGLAAVASLGFGSLSRRRRR